MQESWFGPQLSTHVSPPRRCWRASMTREPASRDRLSRGHWTGQDYMGSDRGRFHSSNLTTSRRNFAQSHLDKEEAFWSSILWSDEMKMELFGHRDVAYVWRKKCEPKATQSTLPTAKHGGRKHNAVGLFLREWDREPCKGEFEIQVKHNFSHNM